MGWRGPLRFWYKQLPHITYMQAHTPTHTHALINRFLVFSPNSPKIHTTIFYRCCSMHAHDWVHVPDVVLRYIRCLFVKVFCRTPRELRGLITTNCFKKKAQTTGTAQLSFKDSKHIKNYSCSAALHSSLSAPHPLLLWPLKCFKGWLWISELLVRWQRDCWSWFTLA